MNDQTRYLKVKNDTFNETEGVWSSILIHRNWNEFFQVKKKQKEPNITTTEARPLVLEPMYWDSKVLFREFFYFT